VALGVSGEQIATSSADVAVNVSAAPDIPPALVTRTLAETDAVWRHSGRTFAWRRTPREDAAATLQVVIGRGVGPVRDGGFALGWISGVHTRRRRTELEHGAARAGVGLRLDNSRFNEWESI